MRSNMALIITVDLSENLILPKNPVSNAGTVDRGNLQIGEGINLEPTPNPLMEAASREFVVDGVVSPLENQTGNQAHVRLAVAHLHRPPGAGGFIIDVL